MAIESIDSVLEQLVLTGGSKIDWKEGESRALVESDWSISDHADGGQLFNGHLHPTTITRMQQLTLLLEVDDPHDNMQTEAELCVLFDPLTRRIEAMEVWDITYATTVLTLFFWPGLESARKLVIATMAHWQQAIADGWFEGVG